MARAKTNTIDKGTTVSWKWGTGKATGKVVEKSTHKVTKTIKGARVTRNASTENPGLTIKQANGKTVLKSKREVKVESKKNKS